MQMMKTLVFGVLLLASAVTARDEGCVTREELESVKSQLQAACQQQVDDLRETMQIRQDTCQQRVEDIQETVKDLTSDVKDVKINVEDLTSNVEELRRQSSPVAFTASHSEAQVVADQGKFQFDTIHTNVGGGFDTITSEFICPISGYYIFSVSLLSSPGNTANARIDINGTRGPRSNSSDTRANGGGTYSLYCAAGERVSVVQDHWSGAYSASVFQANYSSFSGILVTAD